MMVDVSRRSFRHRVYWRVARMAVRLIDFFVQCHIVNSRQVHQNLNAFGIKKPVEYMITPVKYASPFPKQKHDGFNVLYYFPDWANDGFSKWLYGYDIFMKLKENIQLPGINFIVVNGDSDMTEIYPITDFYLRCNRHDGNSRMIRECDIQNILYYWSSKDPSETGAAHSIITAYNLMHT